GLCGGLRAADGGDRTELRDRPDHVQKGAARVSSPATPPPPVRRIRVDAEPTVVAPTTPATTNGGHSNIGLPAPLRRPQRATEGVERMRTEELTVYYAGKPAVKDVTLPVRSGEVLSLIGPSGCGKTTLLRTLHRPTSRAR